MPTQSQWYEEAKAWHEAAVKWHDEAVAWQQQVCAQQPKNPMMLAEEFNVLVDVTPEVISGIVNEGPWRNVSDLRRAVIAGEITQSQWSALVAKHRFDFQVFGQGHAFEDTEVELRTLIRRTWKRFLIALMVGRLAK